MDLSIFDLFINFLESFLMVYFFVRYFRMKDNFNLAIFVLWGIIGGITTTLVNVYVGYDGLFSILIALMLWTPILLYYAEGPILEKLYMSLFIYELISMINMTIFIIASFILYQGIDLNEVYTSRYYYFLVIMTKVGFLIVSQILAKIRRQIKATMDGRSFLVFIVTSCISTIVYVYLDVILFSGYFDVDKIALAMIGTLLINVFIFILFFRLQANGQKLLESELKIQALSFQSTISEAALVANKETRKMKHDLKHYLLHLDYLLDSGDVEEARADIHAYMKSVDKQKKVVLTSNEVLNYISNSKYSVANTKGINIRFVINYSKSLEINDIDLTTLLGNAIDNAIENSEGDTITIRVEEKNDFLHICVKNTILKSVLDENPNLKTKKRKRGHGYGVKSMKEIAKRNGGMVEFYERDDLFICSILIK